MLSKSPLVGALIRMYDWCDNPERMRRWVKRQWKLHVGASCYMPHQGPRECARRVRQMAKAGGPR